MWGRRRIVLVAAAALAIIMLHPVITVDRDTHNKQRCDQDDIFEWEPGETIENCKIRDFNYTKQKTDIEFGIFRLPEGGITVGLLLNAQACEVFKKGTCDCWVELPWDSCLMPQGDALQDELIPADMPAGLPVREPGMKTRTIF